MKILIAAKNILTLEFLWHLLHYLTISDKLMSSYVNKELYFIIHDNKKFEKELLFFLNLKFK